MIFWYSQKPVCRSLIFPCCVMCNICGSCSCLNLNFRLNADKLNISLSLLLQELQCYTCKSPAFFVKRYLNLQFSFSIFLVQSWTAKVIPLDSPASSSFLWTHSLTFSLIDYQLPRISLYLSSHCLTVLYALGLKS